MTSGLFYKLGSAMARARWLVLAVWLLLVIGIGSNAAKLGDVLDTGGFNVDNSMSQKAKAILKKEFPDQSPNVIMVLHKGSQFGTSDPQFKAAVKKTSERLEKDSRVKQVINYLTGAPGLVSEDNDTSLTLVYLKERDAEKSLDSATVIAGKAVAENFRGIEVRTTGESLFWKDFSELSEKDLTRGELIGLPIAAIVLFFAFGSLVASGIPLLLALAALGVSFGGLYFLGQIMPLNIYVQNTAAMIGLGLGIDYSLLMVSRFREELALKGDVQEAVSFTVDRAGRAVFFSGIAVVIAISGLWLVNMQIFHGFAAGVAIVAAVTVLAALTLLPAVLAILGPRINRLGFSRHKGVHEKQRDGLWRKWAFLIMGKPFIFFFLAAALLLAMASPVINLKLGQQGTESMPGHFASRQGLDLLNKEFGRGALSRFYLVVQSEKSILSAGNLEKLATLEKKLSADPDIKQVEGISQFKQMLEQNALLMANLEQLQTLTRSSLIPADISGSGSFPERVSPFEPPIEQQMRLESSQTVSSHETLTGAPSLLSTPTASNGQGTSELSHQPTSGPTNQQTHQPTSQPSNEPTNQLSHQPTGSLTEPLPPTPEDALEQESILTRTPEIPKKLDPLKALPQLIQSDPRIKEMISRVVNENGAGKVAAIRITPRDTFSSPNTKKLVRDIQGRYVNKASKDGFTLYVGGDTAEDLEFTDEVWSSFPKIFGLVFALTFIILLILFRSLILPVKAVLMNALSVFSAYGLLVLTFQYGIGDELLGFQAPGFVGSFTPLFLFCIIFGLSMDYEVFLLSRIKETYDKTGDNAKSVAEGLEKTARIITSAALIMIAVFSAFALTELVPIKETGMGLALAIFLDATLVRIILVPATMQLMGKWNWWMPRWMQRILPQVRVD